MKILVFAHRLEVGGTQWNAIELAAALRDFHGHEVVIFATPGPMVRLIQDKGLRYLPAPEAHIHPAPARMRALRDAVRREHPDLIHAWDWWQCLDAYYSVHLPMRVPMVVTDMMMDLTRILPKTLPTTFGTPEIVDKARAAGRRRVELILPPVDVHLNAPGAANPQLLRDKCGVRADEIALVTVSRIDRWMKSESLIRTIDAVRRLGRELPLKFLIVGDGAARVKLQQLADEANTELGRPAVILTGALLDPRPAYAAADIVVGMGGSSLRGMAFGKAVIVVGEKGFSAPFTPETADSFLYRGMYGKGDGGPDNAHHIEDIRKLAGSVDQRAALGEFSRQFILRNFSLEVISERLAKFCQRAVTDPPGLHTSAADALRTAAVYLRERRFLTPSRDRPASERMEGTAS